METTNRSDIMDGETGTSHSLISRAINNDAEAWERLVKLYSPLVYFWCQKSGLPSADVQDIFQDVFHTLARGLSKFSPRAQGTFRGWLRTITRNKLNDHFRRLAGVACPMGGSEGVNYLNQLPAAEQNSTDDSTDVDLSERAIQHSILLAALENIRPNFVEQTWNAFWMVVVDGRETVDVAIDLTMSPGAVRVAKSRVLKRLRMEMGELID